MSETQSSEDQPESGGDLPETPSAEAEAEAPEEQLLREGNPLRYIRGSIAIALGSFVAFCLMAVKAQLRFGVPLAAACVMIATFGVLDLVGSFDDAEERVAGRATLRDLAKPLALLAGGLGAMSVFLSLAVDGRLAWGNPVIAAGVLIPASFMTAIVGAYGCGERLGVWEGRPDGTPRPLLHRHGFWLVLLTTVLYLPTLGSHSLSDPWETHYGEVGREILARNDWISLWWAQDGWFWSKPVLDFWIQALAMATFGVRYQPGAMLSAAREGRVPWPEWSVRLPVFLLTLIAIYLLYKAVAHVFGRRAGLLGGVVLVTMPQWFLITHQTMTDMPFVAPMAAAMALLLLGAHTDPEVEVRAYEVDLGLVKLRLSAYHLVIGAVVACALPQILYLVSRNVLLDIRGFHFHQDAFSSGSPGNCGLPGNEACKNAYPVLRGLHPALQALIWAQAIALVVYMNWGERRRQRLLFLAAWLFAALSTMAKGPAGFGLPVLCALAYVAVSKRWRDLLRLEIASGVLILLAVALPWFVAMYARHGQPFTDRLLFHDMFKRAFTHVHDTNEGDDVSFRYYVWQLGYATFPWTGLVPAGLVWWLRKREENDRKSDASVFLAMWFVFAFSLFSLMLTKFHHYILPAVPPAAMLTGVLLDAMLRRTLDRKGDEGEEAFAARPPLDLALYAAGLTAGTVVALLGVARLVTAARKAGPGMAQALGIGGAIAAVGLAGVVLTVVFVGKRREEAEGQERAEGESESGSEGDVESESGGDAGVVSSEAPAARAMRVRFERVLLGGAAIAGGILVLVVGRDLSATYEGVYNQIRLVHLFSYNYRRPWPASLDFTATLWAFTAVGALFTAAIVIARHRRHAVLSLLALSVVFAAWGLDVFFMKVSPHWGQRETVMAYFRASKDVPGPLVAYQMNWKGENFYSGNHVAAFVSSGKKFQDYIQDEKRKGTKVFYVMTEHGRAGTLQTELGSPKVFDKLTPVELNNKFLLVRAQFD